MHVFLLICVVDTAGVILNGRDYLNGKVICEQLKLMELEKMRIKTPGRSFHCFSLSLTLCTG